MERTFSHTSMGFISFCKSISKFEMTQKGVHPCAVIASHLFAPGQVNSSYEFHRIEFKCKSEAGGLEQLESCQSAQYFAI